MADIINVTIVTYENPAALHMISDWETEQKHRIVSWEEDAGMYRATLLPQDGYAPEIVYMVPCFTNVSNYDLDVATFEAVRTKAMVETNEALPFYKWLHFGKVPIRFNNQRSYIHDVPRWVHAKGKR